MEVSLPIILESIIPLYFGFIAYFVKCTKEMNSPEAEEVIEKICLDFEQFKPYLIDNWDKKD